jgi:hypothetical protein
MSPWNEREIARKLAERDELEPPAGLLEKIKGEIPPTITVGVPRLETRRPAPSPQRWLIAASLVAAVGAGFFALHLPTEAPRMAAMPAVEHKADVRAEPRARLSAPPPEAIPQGAGEPALPPPPPPPQLRRKDQEALKALGYVGPPERQAGVVGGVAGGTVAAAPPPAAPPPAAPVAAPQPKPQQPQQEDRITVTAESPLPDERRISTGATVNQAELEKIPTVKAAPSKAAKDRSADENGSGRMSDFDKFEEMFGPSFEEASTHPVSTFLLSTGSSLDAVPGKRARGDLAITAEGAPTPYVSGPRSRLLRFHLDGVPVGAQVTVELNPTVVARYRRIDGDGADALYEIELRSELPQKGRVAALVLNDPSGTRRELALSALAPSWEQASPDFRLSALTARFLDVLKRAPSAKEDLAGIVRQVREIGKQPGGARTAELADRMEKAAGLRPSP